MPNDLWVFEGLCAGLEDYLKDLGLHAQLEIELLHRCFAQEDGRSG
ncbi:MAG: hypothetical protein J5J06_00185 [Phycisphaerae bacterium]|nr:hypothetical protein [Phycisphaerae bacterium]